MRLNLWSNLVTDNYISTVSLFFDHCLHLLWYLLLLKTMHNLPELRQRVVIISYAYQFTTYSACKSLAVFSYTHTKNKQQFSIEIFLACKFYLLQQVLNKTSFKTLLAWLVTVLSAIFENLVTYKVYQI